MKRWDATLDFKTRSTHANLDGQTVQIDEYFESDEGKVFAPHEFGIASQDINCRCRLSSVPLWDTNSENFTRKDNISGEIIPYLNYDKWKSIYRTISKYRCESKRTSLFITSQQTS